MPCRSEFEREGGDLTRINACCVSAKTCWTMLRSTGSPSMSTAMKEHVGELANYVRKLIPHVHNVSPALLSASPCRCLGELCQPSRIEVDNQDQRGRIRFRAAMAEEGRCVSTSSSLHSFPPQARGASSAPAEESGWDPARSPNDRVPRRHHSWKGAHPFPQILSGEAATAWDRKRRRPQVLSIDQRGAFIVRFGLIRARSSEVFETTPFFSSVGSPTFLSLVVSPSFRQSSLLSVGSPPE